MDLREGIKHYLGIASVALGVLGIAKPSLLGRLMETDDEEARELGFRDLVVGLAIYSHPRLGVAQRGLLDLGDAFTFAKRKPAVVPVALGTAALCAYYLLSER